jgi:uncharacterized protein (DUF433 family)
VLAAIRRRHGVKLPKVRRALDCVQRKFEIKRPLGRPVIAGTGIPVSSIYERYKAGDLVAELAQDFRLETSEVEEAIRCEAA